MTERFGAWCESEKWRVVDCAFDTHFQTDNKALFFIFILSNNKTPPLRVKCRLLSWFWYSLARCSCLRSKRTTKTFDTRHTQSDEEHFLYDFNGWNLHNFIIQFCSIVRAHTAPCSECSRMTFNDCKTFSRVCWSSFALVSIVSEIEIQMRSLMSFKQNLGIVRKSFPWSITRMCHVFRIKFSLEDCKCELLSFT